jgi:site-specific DNA-cytosine methylase
MERRRIKPLGNAVIPQIPEAIGRAIMKSSAVTEGEL